MMFVRNDCKSFRFCTSKCHKNFRLKRNPRKVKWTKAFRKSNGKEMRMDTTFEFERRRNRPVKYDRELMGKTIKAMKKVQEIKSAREQRFYEDRMRDNKGIEKKIALKELETGIDLIRAPNTKQKIVENQKSAERKRAEAAARKAERDAAKATGMDTTA
jgi:large subunit ribosomal protein L24e